MIFGQAFADVIRYQFAAIASSWVALCCQCCQGPVTIEVIFSIAELDRKGLGNAAAFAMFNAECSASHSLNGTIGVHRLAYLKLSQLHKQESGMCSP